MPYFGELVGGVKIQTTSKNSQRYYTTKRLISNTPSWYVRASEFRGYLFTRTGMELAREIKLTDWSMAGNLSNRSSGVQIPRDICTRTILVLNTERSYKRQGHAPLKHLVGFLYNGGKPK